MDRLLAVCSSFLATGAFVVVRNARDLEDTEFVVALVAASASAFALTAILGALLRRRALRTVMTGIGASALVPLLYMSYLVLFTVSVCLIGGRTCYS